MLCNFYSMVISVSADFCLLYHPGSDLEFNGEGPVTFSTTSLAQFFFWRGAGGGIFEFSLCTAALSSQEKSEKPFLSPIFPEGRKWLYTG